MQKHQRGSVLGFVVVGALLAIAVVGGIYLVKNQLNGNMPNIPAGDEVAVIEDETDQSDTNTDTNNDSTEGTNSDQDQVDESTDTNTDDTADQPNHSGEQPAEDQGDVAVEDEADSSDEAATSEDQDDMPQSGVETEQPVDDLPQTGVVVDELPQTGLADGVYALVALGALTGAIVAFRRSNIV